MNAIRVKTQAEFDALPSEFNDFTVIEIRSDPSVLLSIAKIPKNSRAELWGSSRAELWGSSRAELWESSSAVLRGSSTAYTHDVNVTVNLFSFAVCFAIVAAKITKKAKTATIIKPKEKEGVNGWLEKEGVSGHAEAVVYKRVSMDFKTQEGTANETTWTPGTNKRHESWRPAESECGAGKFHACSRPYFCDEFRGQGKDFGNDKDRYIAIAVKKKDLHAWENPSYPHKIAFREGRVLHECDRFGEKI